MRNKLNGWLTDNHNTTNPNNPILLLVARLVARPVATPFAG